MTKTTSSGIAYDDLGAGEPALLLLPGWCGSRSLYEPLAGRLQDHFRVLTLDWRGHGESAAATGDFGFPELVSNAEEVLDDAGAGPVVPVATAHAGWAAIELRRRLGAGRISHVVFLDWMVLGAGDAFRQALVAMSTPEGTRPAVDQLTAMWLAGLDLPELEAYVRAMSDVEDDMWARAARAIGREFDGGSPLQALKTLQAPPRTLHLYAQPADPAYLDAQREFAASHPWFEVDRLPAQSHFPVFEVPDRIAVGIKEFIRTV